MKLTVVGFWGGFPGKDEATSGYLLEADGFSLLLDCGSGVLSKLQHFTEIENLDALWLSHYHHDHIADLGPLYFARLIKGQLQDKKGPFPIYGHTLDQEGFQLLTNEEVTKGVAYEGTDTLTIGPFQLTFVKTIHPAPCYAARITYNEKVIVYTADTAIFPELYSFAEGADLLIAECSLYEGQDGAAFGHMTSAEVAELAEKAKVKDVLLTHLPHYGDHQELLQRVKQQHKGGQVSLAETGWKWEG
ncbi:MBL fold metallo-hydrolase [Pullulanibacillus sp. KACC 23026]|uniref:MBL fold metallo-hydrolase n=1 Tax=Pullulanibacillus sp. KACC 23026 TaxID=3028315 RepID=UPI0023B02B64|nr:MBL fold metallo-hydrolase [Pullulanibacillus sp. KACC 23026]WEG12019.1 MBL fold metallo-hydrolase [Pullulanibacillus sp. KACC 23026]